MIPDIITKLEAELTSGIKTEVQVVYILVQVRKILEQTDQVLYKYLNFYCNWALHPKIDKNSTANELINQFDAANIHLANGLELSQLPTDLRRSIDKITKMELFKEELISFLKHYNLPSIVSWVHFLYLYTQVIKDCPLEIRARIPTQILEK